MEGFNRAPRYITFSDNDGTWGYFLHFPDITLQEVAALTETLEALAELGQRYGQQVIGATSSHNYASNVAFACIQGYGDEATRGHPFYKALRQRIMPTFHYTALHKVESRGDKACDVAFRILGSEPSGEIESKLVTAADSLKFPVKLSGLDHVVSVTGGTQGYDNLRAAFQSHSVYLKPLTAEQRTRLS